MYIPKHFNETDMKKIRELMAAYPLATVIASVPELDAEDQDEGLSPKKYCKPSSKNRGVSCANGVAERWQ